MKIINDKILLRFLTASLLFISVSTFAKEAPLVVSAKPLSELLIRSTFSAPANIISLNHSVISAEIMGSALSIDVEAGDFVKKGQKLAALDCRSYVLAKKQALAALKVANTQLNYSQKQLRRNQQLIKKGIIPRETFEKAEAGQLTALADIELKKASIATADLSISRCQIRAPYSGQITSRLVQKGQLVTTGTPLYKLMQSNSLEIKANLPADEVAKLKAAQSLEFVAGNVKFKTKLRSIIQTVDEVARTQEVRLTLPKKARLATGLSGRVEWSNQALQLPAEYIVRRANQLGVMLVKDQLEGIGKVKFHPLPNAKEGQPTGIDLPDNSAIITTNRYRVKDSDLVQVK